MSVKAYHNTPSDKPPDYYFVETSEVTSQSRATRSSKPTELYEYSPTKKALRRLSGKFKRGPSLEQQVEEGNGVNLGEERSERGRGRVDYSRHVYLK